MGITFGDYLTDSGHYDPPHEDMMPLDGYYDTPEGETMAIPLEAMGDAGPSERPAVGNKDAIARLILRAMHQSWDAEVYGESRAEEANRNIADMTADAILSLNQHARF